MLVVVDCSKLVRTLDVVRDDKKPRKKLKAEQVPYLRFAATEDGNLRLSGLEVEATFPATVHEPGVLFIRAQRFRDVLATMRKEKMITIQASAEELAFGNVHLPMATADILLYADPATAPQHHPGDRQRAHEASQAEIVAARKRVQDARDRIVVAAENMLNAEAELAKLLNESFDPRKTLAKLLDQVTPAARRKRPVR
ncbi:MAG: hypothetical protein GXY83_30715 [Rhodopirellula sp.]|nr:hypothetical protein [Rhodopirellula sp.]